MGEAPTLSLLGGRGRRHLENGAELVSELKKRNLRVALLDMATLSMSDQNTACNQSKVVIGIRGAEFANLIWMRPEASAIMLGTPVGMENNGTRSLATIYGLRFTMVPVDSSFVHLNPAQISQLVEIAVQSI